MSLALVFFHFTNHNNYYYLYETVVCSVLNNECAEEKSELQPHAYLMVDVGIQFYCKNFLYNDHTIKYKLRMKNHFSDTVWTLEPCLSPPFRSRSIRVCVMRFYLNNNLWFHVHVFICPTFCLCAHRGETREDNKL